MLVSYLVLYGQTGELYKLDNLNKENCLIIFSGWFDETTTLIYIPIFINRILIIGSFFTYHNPTKPSEIVYDGPIIDEVNVVPLDYNLNPEHKMFYKATIDNKFKVFEVNPQRQTTERNMVMIIGYK